MIKKMNIAEFRNMGYLQELNRNFLHPLGLALEIKVDEKGEESLGGIWDYREDAEGIIYDVASFNDEQKKEFLQKMDIVNGQFLKRFPIRKQTLGFEIESL